MRRHWSLAGLAAFGTQVAIALIDWLLPLAPVGATGIAASPRLIFEVCAELAAGMLIGLAFPRAVVSVALFVVPTVLIGSLVPAFTMPGESGPGNPLALLGSALLAFAILALFFLGYGAGYAVAVFLRRRRTSRLSNPLATDRSDTSSMGRSADQLSLRVSCDSAQGCWCPAQDMSPSVSRRVVEAVYTAARRRPSPALMRPFSTSRIRAAIAWSTTFWPARVCGATTVRVTRRSRPVRGSTPPYTWICHRPAPRLRAVPFMATTVVARGRPGVKPGVSHELPTLL